MITFDPTITFGAGAIVGALVTKIIDHFLAKSRTREDRKIKGFNDAAMKFRATIINELTGLYPLPIDWPRDIANRLNTTLPKIQAAVEEFKPSIAAGEIKAFNKAWLQYYTHCKHVIPDAFSLANRLYGAKSPQNVRDEFKHNVDSLLSFAKER